MHLLALPGRRRGGPTPDRGRGRRAPVRMADWRPYPAGL